MAMFFVLGWLFKMDKESKLHFLSVILLTKKFTQNSTDLTQYLKVCLANSHDILCVGNLFFERSLAR